MASVEDPSDVLNASMENVSSVENASNATGREAATFEGIVITYTALFTMALGPILIGSLRSVPYHSAMRVSRREGLGHTPLYLYFLEKWRRNCG